MCVQNLKSVALDPILSYYRGTQKCGQSVDMPTLPLLKKFLLGFTLVRMHSMNVPALPVPELIGGTQKLGRSLAMPTQGEAIGVGNGTVRKSVGEFLQAVHSNFSFTFTRFRLPLLFSSTPLFPYPSSSLLRISPCTPWKYVDRLFATKSECVGICLCN